MGTGTDHVVPGGDDRFHVQITREEGHDSIWNDLAHVDEDASEISHNRRIVSHLESRGYWHLIRSSSNDHGKEGITLQRHRVRGLTHRLKLQHLRVHVERRDRSGRDDDRREPLEDRLDCKGRVETSKMSCDLLIQQHTHVK